MPIKFIIEQELALEAFSSGAYLQTNKTLLRMYGLEMAGFIGNLVDKFKYFRSKNMLTGGGGFFLTHADQIEQIGISEYQLCKYKKKCKELGILTTKMIGIPPKEFYFLDFKILVELYENHPQNKAATPPKKLVNNGCENTVNNGCENTVNNGGENTVNIRRLNIKENKYKENKYIVRNGSSFFLAEQPESEPESTQNRVITRTRQQSVPYDEIMTSWNSIAENKNLPKIRSLTTERRNKIKTRTKILPTMDDWGELLNMVEKSSFLCGENNNGWAVTFDWLIENDKNPTKVLEGNYTNKKKQSSNPEKFSSFIAAEPGKYKNIKTTVLHNDYKKP